MADFAESMADMTPAQGGPMKMSPPEDQAGTQNSDPVSDQGLQSTASEGTADPSGQPDNAAGGEGVQPGDSAAASPGDDTPPPVLPSHLKPEDAYQFGQYHQRRADKITQEFNEFKQQAQDVAQLRPILDAITQDPELYQQVQRKFAQPGAPAQAPQEEIKIEFPDVPDGVFDDDQASVVRSLMGQFKDVIEQLATQNQRLTQKLTGFEQTTQQTQAQSQRQQAIQDLMFNYSLSAPEAEAFMRDMVDERKYLQDPSMLVNAWRASQRPSADQVRAQHNVQKSQQQQQSRTPSMAASGGAASAPPATNGLFVEQEGGFDPFEPIR